MNIFCLEKHPIFAAQILCDQHVVKMPTETSQMLACALIKVGAPKDALPLTKAGTRAKGGYPNHPCSKWASESRQNFLWLCAHGIALCREYTARYGKTHFCEAGIKKMQENAEVFNSDKLKPFAIAINEDSRCRSLPEFYHANTIGKYRLFYKHDKSFAKWSRNRPNWLDKTDNEIIMES